MNYDRIITENPNWNYYYLGDGWHRLDGPAIELKKNKSRGNKSLSDEFYIRGKWFSENEFNHHPMVIEFKNLQLMKFWIEL